MRVVAARTDDLDEPTRSAVIRLCVSAHDEPDFERLFAYIPSGGRHYLAYEGDQLVSHAVVTTRWIRPGAHHRLRTAYGDAVATLPDRQRRGYGSAVIRQLAADLGDDDIACLETERPAFYARLGWDLWRGPLAGIRGAEIIPTPDQQGVMILRLARTPALDLDGDLAIECHGDRIW